MTEKFYIDTQYVRDSYVNGAAEWMPEAERRAEFDRWLATLIAAQEPSKAEVDAALRAWTEEMAGRDLADEEWEAVRSQAETAAMRAALCAASRARSEVR